MLQVAAMSSNTPNNWKRPWIEEIGIPSITLPNPTSARERKNSEPSIPRNSQQAFEKSTTQNLRNVDPEDRLLHAMPKASSPDNYTQYLLAQDSPENSTKRMRMSTSPWLDLKGKGSTTQRQESQRSESNGESRSTASSWAPIPEAAARPREMSGLYASVQSRHHASHCNSCAKAQSIAPEIAKGAQKINEQLKSAVVRRQSTGEVRNTFFAKIYADQQQNGLEVDGADGPIPEDLLDTLGFSLGKINDSMRLVKDLLYNIHIDDDKRPFQSRAPLEDERRQSHLSRSTSPHSENRSSSREPYPSTVLSRSPPSRHLSSPNPFHLPSVGAVGVSPKTTDLNTMAYQIQELQQQLDAKTTSHRTLEAGYAQMRTAHSDVQAKYALLGKKSSVADTEVTSLIEERTVLQVQVESLEQQVTELQYSRDSAQTQSAASASQYLQIMAMSSKLQAQGAIDLKKYKADREAWAAQKGELEQKILDLEKAHGTASIFAATLAASGKTIEEQNVVDETELANMSFDKLKDEILRLRRNFREASTVIQTIREEGSAITKLTDELGAAGERLMQLGVVPPPAPPSPSPKQRA